MKAAVHIGVNEYDPIVFGRGNDLRMCVLDAQRMEALSLSKGYDEVTVLTDKEATFSKWRETLVNLSKRLRNGDTLLISQSSHGTYQDLPDGKRQTGLVLYDSIVWDFEVREILRKFRAGVLIVWICDACFSESNWRMAAPIGGRRKYSKVRFLPTTTDHDPNWRVTGGDKRNIKAIFISLSSSNAWQESYETEEGGLFTTAINTALVIDPNLTYYQIWRRASEWIAQRDYPQTPIMETVRADAYTGCIFLTREKPMQ